MQTETFLREVVAVWEQIIPRSQAAKWRQFSRGADRAWAFVGSTYEELYIDARDEQGQAFPFAEDAVWKTRRNLSREYISVMLPYIHAKVPNRLASPRRPGIPSEVIAMAQTQYPPIAGRVQHAAMIQSALQPVDAMRSFMLKWWLNYLPSEYNLYGEQRRALPEALVKGRACLWVEMEEGPYGPIPVSTYDSVNGLFCDPDARSFKRQNFIIRQRVESVVSTAKKFGIPMDELRGSYESNLASSQKIYSSPEGTGADLIPTEKDGDVCVYYEVYSRIGIGHWLKDAPDSLKDLEATMSALGDACYLAIMPGVEYPLNLPPTKLGDEPDIADLKARLAWPIPFHADKITDPWPVVVLDFLPNSNDPWATSPLDGCLPLLAWLDHSYSYLMSKVKVSCRNLFMASKQLKESLVNGIAHGQDMEILWYDGEPGIEFDKLFKRVDFPEFKKDLLILTDKVEMAFQNASGMTSALYGGAPQTQDRSATATRAREQRLSSRPDDFADCVEEWNSRDAAKEALATRLYVGKDVIMPFFGEQDTKVPDPQTDPEAAAIAQQQGIPLPEITVSGPLTQLWEELVQVGKDGMTEEEIIEVAAHASAEMSYTVEAGSGRRRNQAKLAEDFNQLSSMLLQPFIQMAMAGNVDPYNWLIGLAGDIFDRSVDGAMLKKGEQQGEQPDPAAEAQAQAQQQQMQLDQQKSQQELQGQQQEMDASSQQTQMQQQAMQAEMQAAQQAQQLAMQQQAHEQKTRHAEEKHQHDLKVKTEQAKQKPKPKGK
jgi:hypothetical protein